MNYLLYNADSGVIFGISSGCYKSFGIPSSLIYGNSQYVNEFTMDIIIPELMNPENIEKIRIDYGCLLTLDTSLLQQNFLIAQGESDRESDATQKEDRSDFMLYFLELKEKNIIYNFF